MNEYCVLQKIITQCKVKGNKLKESQIISNFRANGTIMN